MIIWSPKPAAAVAAYAFEFADFLAEGETISGTPLITPDGVTVTGGPTVSGTQVQIELSGGTEGSVAKVVCTITTSAGEIWPALAVLAINGEALSLADAKAAARIDGSDEDVILAAFLRAAIGSVETVTGKNLVPKIETQIVDGFHRRGAYAGFASAGAAWMGCGGAHDAAIRLWKGPVSEILSIDYDDVDGVTQTLASFRLVEGREAKLLPAYGEFWPMTAHGPGTVRIHYVAGYDATELPPELTQAALLLFGHFNANREAVIADTRAAAVELPLAVQFLIGPFCGPGLA